MSEHLIRGPKLDHDIRASLGEFFFEHAERFGDRICQTDARLNKSETYSTVNMKSVRVALEMQKRGITSQDVVVLCTKVTLDNLIPIIASFYLGAKVANLDPVLSVRQTTHLLSLVSPKMIFVEDSSVKLIEDSLKQSNLNPEIVVFESSHKYSTLRDFLKPNTNEKKFEPIKVDLQDTAVIIFSSGTTGLPKPICHSHYSFLSLSYSFYLEIREFETTMYFTSFYWISGLLLLICTSIVGGQRIFSSIIDPELTFRSIEKYKVTFLFLAPILTYKITNFEKIKHYDTSSLNVLFIGGTPISSVQLQRLEDTFTHSHVILGYGCTEVGVTSIFNPKTDLNYIKSKNGSCGKLASGFIVKILDVTTKKCLGPYEHGEIYVKSQGTMKGYYNMSSSFVYDDDGFLKTGDIGFYDEDKCFFIVGRIKEMFKYMSWHVVPSSIESVLIEHPAIKEAMAFGIPQNEEIGELPAACVVLEKNYKIKKNELEKFVAERVNEYEKLRGGVIFVESLIKTPTGKLMREEMKKSLLNKL